MDELDEAIERTEAELAEARRALAEAKRRAAPDAKLVAKVAEARHYADALEAELGTIAVELDRRKEQERRLEEELQGLRPR